MLSDLSVGESMRPGAMVVNNVFEDAIKTVQRDSRVYNTAVQEAAALWIQSSSVLSDVRLNKLGMGPTPTVFSPLITVSD